MAVLRALPGEAEAYVNIQTLTFCCYSDQVWPLFPWLLPWCRWSVPYSRLLKTDQDTG
jgi:hypothetical protein